MGHDLWARRRASGRPITCSIVFISPCASSTKHACYLTRHHSVRRCRFGGGIEYHQGVSDEIERPLYLSVPETPTDMLDGVGQAGSFRAVARRGVRPALGGLSDMLDAHREMKTIEHVMGRPDARCLAQRSWPVGAVAQDGYRRSRCGTKAMQYAAQLLLLPISLGRHTAEHGPLAGVVADLRDEDLERPYPIAVHRFHVTSADGERVEPASLDWADVGAATASRSSRAPTRMVR